MRATDLPIPRRFSRGASWPTVLADLQRKSPRSKNTRQNLVIFRLACCCGLRASEIAQLQIGDVRVDVVRPHLRIRRGAAKGGKSRTVPLWWDAGTLADLAAWKAQRSRVGSRFDFAVRRIAAAETESTWRIPATRSASGSARRAKYLGRSDSKRSRSTTAGTRSSAMPWPAAARWPKSVMRRATPT